MFKSLSHLKNKFKIWGKQQNMLPPRNEEIKKIILEKVKSSTSDLSIKKTQLFLWFKFSMVGISVLILVFIFNFIHNSNRKVAATDFGMTDVETGISGTLGNLPELGTFGKITKKVYGLMEDSQIDTREFLKTDYGVKIKTRQLNKMFNRIQTIIRGHGGRIDEADIDQKSGHIVFVVPKSDLDKFSTEIKEMIHPKFLTEQISAKNLLSEKQKIEGQTANVSESLTLLEKKQQELKINYDNQEKKIQSEINKYLSSINYLKNEQTTSTARKSEIAVQLNNLNTKYNSLQQLLKKEKKSFDNQIQGIDYQIQTVKLELNTLYNKDHDLISQTETVEGTITLEWISIIDIINLFVPVYWIIIITSISIIIFYIIFVRQRHLDIW